MNIIDDYGALLKDPKRRQDLMADMDRVARAAKRDTGARAADSQYEVMEITSSGVETRTYHDIGFLYPNGTFDSLDSGEGVRFITVDEDAGVVYVKHSREDSPDLLSEKFYDFGVKEDA